ncbi:MAG: ABC transporter ATP-binding protein/permease [Defluviitaleaceae bacterium]|nr:ABC transporter ATP-binding protein/permease [Defluviitaleaceae bacterium]
MKKYGIFSMAVRTSGMYIRESNWYGALEHTFTAVTALAATGTIIATQRLFDAAAGAAYGEFWYVLAPLGLLVTLAIIAQVGNGLENFFSEAGFIRNEGRYMQRLQMKLSRIPAKKFEDTGFLDDVEKAREGVSNIGGFAYFSLQFITYYAVFFIAVGAYLFWLSPLLPIVIIISFVPALLGQIAQVKVFAEVEEQNAPERRRFNYYQRAIADREFYKETRILGGFRYFHRLFSQTLLDVTQKVWRTEHKAQTIRLALGLATFAGLGMSLFLLFNAAMSGTITIGAFAAVLASLARIFYIMEEIIMMNMGENLQDAGKLANYFRLMDMEEISGEKGTPDFKRGIKADGVRFTYPGRSESAVNGISLTIQKGETIAIVGENGAGKSTLVRLLTGLYTPDEGKVTIGGLDTRTTHPASISGSTSAVFQNFQRYKMTLGDNVSISDAAGPVSEARISCVLSEAEVGIRGENEGEESSKNDTSLDIMLSPEFDGIDLSGGQWQRVAIARGLYRHNGFIVLDEPTAAIDPLEEARLYGQFKRLAQGKCAIIITHRLGSAKLADRIIVMEKGEIVEEGTHDELVAHPGKYADMWEAQAGWYQE